MSFTIKYKPQDPIERADGGTAQLLALDISSDHPDFAKHTQYLTLLCSQINQVSGLGNEIREHDIRSPESTRICWICNNLATNLTPNGHKPVIRGFLDEFEAAASLGCEICRLLLTAVSPYQGPGRLKAYVRPGAALNIIIKCANKNARYDLFTPLGQPLAPWPGIGPARVVGPPMLPNDELVELLQSWLKECKNHKLCQSPSISDVSPKRIINVTDEQLRLEEPEKMSKPYVALSHCWGTSNLPTAVKDTVASLRQGIEWNTLTKTFQDAIVLTRKLGYKYIWIDSLCILQDDEDEWQTEAPKMAGIYENAELVLSATSAKDGSGGLFRDRKPVQILASDDTPESSVVREYGSDHKVISLHGPECQDKDCPIFISRDTARHAQWDAFDIIRQGSSRFNPLLARAWAFQERLLASRIVHFADHELIWECKEGQRCECMHLDRSDGRPSLERNSENIKVRFSRETSSSVPSESPLALFELWAKVVENYTERMLTYEDDRLPALSGAIQVMQKHDLGLCVGGLFLSDIPRCLLWYVTQPCTRHDTYRAPTWSWASLMPPPKQPPRVKHSWHEFAEGLGTYPHYPVEMCIESVKVLSVPGAGDNEDPTFVLSMSAALLSVQLKVKLTAEPLLDMNSYDFFLYNSPGRTFKYSVVIGTQDVFFYPDILLHTDTQETETTSEVYLVPTSRRYNQQRPDQIMVLRRVESEEQYAGIGLEVHEFEAPVFERIGVIMSLKDEVSGDIFEDTPSKPLILV